MQRTIPRAEVISSTFDEPPTRHVQVAEMVIEKARRLVEHRPRRRDPARLDHPPRARLQLRDAGERQGPLRRRRRQRAAEAKRFFGAARNIEEGGSLTIVATSLIDTGSRMDDVIFEEFKGTGNMEIHLDRRLVDKRIFPAMDINKSGTRKEELLLPEDTLNKIWVLRKVLNPLNVVDSMEFLLEKFKETKTNEDFLKAMNK